MGLFINEDGSLVEAKKTRFANEKEIQQTVENNLESMLNLTLVDSEFSFGSNRIDTLAFDNTRKIFVIIEYKIDEDKKISNQALGYYGDMIANQSDFLVAYHENVGALSKNTVNWKKTRILLIAPKFDESLLSALHDPDVKFELWKINLYQHRIIEFKQLRSVNKRIVEIDSSTSIKTHSLRTGDIESHLKKCNENIRQIYEELERQIMKMTNTEIVITKYYISFTANSQKFIRIYTRKSRLLIYLPFKLKEMNIPKQFNLIIAQKPPTYFAGPLEITITNQSDIMSLTELVKQSYDKTRVIEPIARRSLPKTSEYDTLKKCNTSTRGLYNEIKNQILKLGNDIDVYDTKYRIVFKAKRNFALFRMSKANMLIYLPIPNNEFQRMQVGNLDAVHGSGGEARVKISKRSEIPSLMRLVEYSYNRHVGNGTKVN